MGYTIDHSTGLSTDEIINCKDIEQLRNWKTELICERADIKQQIDKYNIERTMGAIVDYDWYLRAKAVLNIKSKLLYTVDSKLSSLIQDQKRINIMERNVSDDLLVEFIEWYQNQSFELSENYTPIEIMKEFRRYKAKQNDYGS